MKWKTACAADAPGKNIFLRIDMEEYAYKDLTLDTFRRTVEDNPSMVRGPGGGLRLGVVYYRDKEVQAMAA